MKLKPCKTCKPEENPGKFSIPRGFTRHKNQICSRFRKYGPPTDTPNYKGRAA